MLKDKMEQSYHAIVLLDRYIVTIDFFRPDSSVVFSISLLSLHINQMK